MTGRDGKHDKAAAKPSPAAVDADDERFHARLRDEPGDLDDEGEIDDTRAPDDVDDDDTPAIQPSQPLIDRSQRVRKR